ncbi:MAG: glycosyltransferase family 1 protein [Pseudomonadota bacterium]|nr:glycosyltransferase family 1 protein [Pseudomonadota bacterium]
MRIIIDMQGMQTASRTRGIGRYTHAFVRALLENKGDHEVLLALNGLFPETIDPIRAAFRDLLPRENIRVWYAPEPGHWGDPASEVRRQRAEVIRDSFLKSLQPDIVHITSLFEGFGDNAIVNIGPRDSRPPTSVTFYDLIPLHHRERFLSPEPLREKWYLQRLDCLREADFLLAISESSARDAQKALNISGKKITNVSAACSDIFIPSELSKEKKEDLFSRLGINKRFILVSGTIDPHKNLDRFFSSFSCLPIDLRENYTIVLVGSSSEESRLTIRDMARNSGLSGDDLVLTGYVDDEDLVALYNLCSVMAFPSYDEGFGLPVLEAMACGAVTIGANTSSVPEVLGLEAALFDPYDELSIASKLEDVLTDERLRTELRENGLEQARKFSWTETAKRSIRAMEVLVKSRGNKLRLLNRADPLKSCIRELARIRPSPNEAETVALSSHVARSIVPSEHPRQLLVDISELAQRDARTGCQRVTRSILLELLKRPPNGFRVEPVFARIDTSGYFYARDFTSKLLGEERKGADLPIDFAAGDVFFGLDFQASIVPAQRDFLVTLRRHGVDVQILVYDILSVTHSQFFWPAQATVFQHWLETISLFDGVIGISKATIDELRTWYDQNSIKLPPDFRFGWAHLGADIENSAPTYGLPENAGKIVAQLGQRPTFLMVSTIEPRKGYAQALAAFEELWARGSDVNLVIVGKQGWNVDALVHKLRTHPELNSRLFWLEGISDEYLEKIYGAASCLIAASEGEGFGLPLIEAARHKLPILARDIPVFREVAGAHAAYFDGSTPAALAGAVQNWLSAYQNGQHTRSEDMPWITWKESAEQMMTALLDRSDAQSPLHSDDLPRERSISLSA